NERFTHTIVTYLLSQRKLFNEIEKVAGAQAEEISEDDLHRMPYLEAVIMERLSQLSPAHFLLPHSASKDVSINGYLPERFLAGGEGEEVGITGGREIKMMPFGVGRSICPDLNLAMLHLEFFVANLLRQFEWKPVEWEEVDISETKPGG
ncbi:hypothetical protein BHM03_00030123, partial [Ensete ventricosum]